MTKGKLSLDSFKVKSFVTDLETTKMNTVKGGSPTDNCMTHDSCLGSGPDGPKKEEFSGGPICPNYQGSNVC